MDFSFNSSSVGTLQAALHEHGALLLRGAVSKDRVKDFRSAIDEVYALYDADPSRLAQLSPEEAKAIGQGDISPRVLREIAGVEIDEYFSVPKLAALIEVCLVKAHPDLQTVMSVAPDGGRSIRGLTFHTDGIIQGTTDAVITFWSPLHRCGVDAPGLGVIPATRQEIIGFLQRRFPTRSIPGWCSTTEWNDTGAFETATLEREFGPAWTPEMEPGDVMIFTNWTIHGSHVTSAMTHRRSAIIQRWIARNWGQPPGFLQKTLYRMFARPKELRSERQH